MKDKATSGMATDFNKAVIYLKNFVSTIRTKHINLPDVDTDIKSRTEEQYKDIALLNHKSNKRNGGKGKMTKVGASFPTAIKDKFYEGGNLSKFDHQTL